MARTISNVPSAQWSRLWLETSFLMADATLVMMLRSWRMMAGGRVKSPEGAARAALGIYGKRVRGNRRRLA